VRFGEAVFSVGVALVEVTVTAVFGMTWFGTYSLARSMVGERCIGEVGAVGALQ
jgi:hypothetical protein